MGILTGTVLFLVSLFAAGAALATAVKGTYDYAWPLALALLAQAVAGALLLSGRRFVLAVAVLFLAICLLVLYPRGYELGGKSAHYSNYRAVIKLREAMALEEKISGRRLVDLSGIKVPVIAVKNGHGRSREVEIVRLPQEAYTLRVPEKGGYSSVRGHASGRDGSNVDLAYEEAYPEQSQTVALLYPGQEYSYELTGVPAGGGTETLISSGTVAVPEAPGFEKDTGTWAYDPEAGHIFINCTHEPEYKKGWLWWAL